MNTFQTHNLKAAGSNPAPASKPKSLISKRDQALLLSVRKRSFPGTLTVGVCV
jgi:hypothetical protein